MLGDPARRPDPGLLIAHVEREVRLLEPFGLALECVGADVGEQDAGALAGEGLCDGEPYAAGGPGDEGVLVGESALGCCGVGHRVSVARRSGRRVSGIP